MSSNYFSELLDDPSNKPAPKLSQKKEQKKQKVQESLQDQKKSAKGKQSKADEPHRHVPTVDASRPEKRTMDRLSGTGRGKEVAKQGHLGWGKETDEKAIAEATAEALDEKKPEAAPEKPKDVQPEKKEEEKPAEKPVQTLIQYEMKMDTQKIRIEPRVLSKANEMETEVDMKKYRILAHTDIKAKKNQQKKQEPKKEAPKKEEPKKAQAAPAKKGKEAEKKGKKDDKKKGKQEAPKPAPAPEPVQAAPSLSTADFFVPLESRPYRAPGQRDERDRRERREPREPREPRERREPREPREPRERREPRAPRPARNDDAPMVENVWRPSADGKGQTETRTIAPAANAGTAPAAAPAAAPAQPRPPRENRGPRENRAPRGPRFNQDSFPSLGGKPKKEKQAATTSSAEAPAKAN